MIQLLPVTIVIVAVRQAAAGLVESHCFQNQTEYSHLCATQAIRYSSVAYLSDISSILSWDCDSCSLVPELEILKIFQGNEKENFGYIGVQRTAPYNLVLAFRGTSYYSTSSAIADIEFTERRWPDYVPKSTVDHGFLQYFLSVESDIRDTLTEYLDEHPNTPILITGHSLGGATALIAAVALHDLIPDPLIYTFGSPRVGNSYFAGFLHSLLPSKIFRIIHDHDIVPHLPPCSWLPWKRTCQGPKFPTHVPTEILYNEDMSSYKICNSEVGEDDECSDQFSSISLSISEHLYYFGFRVGLPSAVQKIILPEELPVILS